MAILLLLATTLLQAEGGRAIARGPWGGVGVSLQASESGGELWFNCARGTLGGPLRLDAGGRFDVPGTYARGRPGPARQDDPGAREPARYRGRLDGDTLTLEVLLPNSGTTVGPYSLKRGAPARIHWCL